MYLNYYYLKNVKLYYIIVITKQKLQNIQKVYFLIEHALWNKYGITRQNQGWPDQVQGYKRLYFCKNKSVQAFEQNIG